MKEKEIIELQDAFIQDLVQELATISISINDVNEKVANYNTQRLALSLPDVEPPIDLPKPIDLPVEDGKEKPIAITQEEINTIMANDARIVFKDNPKDTETYILYYKGIEKYVVSKKDTLENITTIINSF